MNLSVIFSYLIVTTSLFILSACAGAPLPTTTPEQTGPASVATIAHQPGDDTFILSAGDKIDITVFDDESLSGEYDIDTRGYITMPLIGSIKAADASVTTLQKSLEANLAKGYLVKPLVSIEVISLRPFYISGEVRTPGSYPTVPDLDAFKAIAIAGGLTPRAVKNRYLISRGTGATKQKIMANDDTPVYPGDSIKIDERFF
jgi:polysaccharide export outer membrane protein